MCTRFIEFMVKQLPGAGAMMLPVLFPLLAHTQQEKSRVIFFEPETLDTLFVSELEENQELISFEPKKLKHKYDVVILQKSNSQGSFALHVPAQEGKPNIYRLVKGNSYFPFYLTGEPQKFLVRHILQALALRGRPGWPGCTHAKTPTNCHHCRLD